MKQIFGKINGTYLFIILQTILYGSFLVLDLSDGNISLSNGIKFTLIVLCFCYVFLNQESTDKSILYCLRAALFFTVISDLFILLLDYYLYGVISFLIVQQLYGLRLDIVNSRNRESGKGKPLFQTVILRFALQVIITAGICLLVSRMGVKPDNLLIVTALYFISILTNVIYSVLIAFYSHRKSSDKVFALGMILFLLCDINVGLFNLTDFITIPEDFYRILYSLSTILMWTFYAPSQVLIALSVKRTQQNRQKNG